MDKITREEYKIAKKFVDFALSRALDFVKRDKCNYLAGLMYIIKEFLKDCLASYQLFISSPAHKEKKEEKEGVDLG